MADQVLSVGIDIGTTTSQVVFSRLTLANTASAVSMPRIDIVAAEVIHRSTVHFTPLRSAVEIDAGRLREIMELEYRQAGVAPGQVKTGAVIITGETARKENAAQVLENLSGLAGDFVVATAGPALEGILAGKGSGAQQESLRFAGAVANLDIGGGTTNVAIFRQGKVIDTACYDLGGRLLRFTDRDHRLAAISPKMAALCTSLSLPLAVGHPCALEDLRRLAQRVAILVEEILGLRPVSAELGMLVTDKDLDRTYPIEAVCFSGGVADCMVNQHWNDFEYGDFGVFLGRALSESRILSEKTVLVAKETIRATVIGAGSHSTTISGSTITVDETQLPLKNLPVFKLDPAQESLPYGQWPEVIRAGLARARASAADAQPALALIGSTSLGFAALQEMAAAIIEGMASDPDQHSPLVVIVEQDLARSLGQALRLRLAGRNPVICLDSVKVEDGDYIDIGRSLAGGKVVPVIVKTLLFGF